ncbi:hypothetical protein [Mycolicibacterium peregrinum]|uniref:hypothetical protein n=1 Tax=Mycolicibacterium peregrinum TaxID=43304 RepID=UPI003AAD8980
MSDEPRFIDVVNPTPEEIRAWAYGGAFEPMQDWDLVIAGIDNVELLLELIGDRECPARDYLLDSLYCLFGHSDLADPRLLRAAEEARAASDPWVATWGRRVCQSSRIRPISTARIGSASTVIARCRTDMSMPPHAHYINDLQACLGICRPSWRLRLGGCDTSASP